MLQTWAPPQEEFVGTISTGNRTIERYSGCKALWMRVIIRAAFDLASYKDDPRIALRKYADNAHKWLFDKSFLFNSFENVCAMLGLPPEPIRNWASSLTKEEVQKMEHLERGSVKLVQSLLSRRVESDDVED